MQRAATRWRGLGRSASGGGERRFGQGGRWVLAFALALLAAGAAQQLYRLSLPTLGWRVNTALDSDVPVFQANLLGLPSPLRPGDVLVALDGRPLPGDVFVSPDGPPLREAWLGLSLSGRFGDEVRVSVRRDGALRAFSVPVGSWTAGAVWAAAERSVRANPFTLLGLLISAFVFWQRPQNTAARLLLLYHVSQLAILLSRLLEPAAGLSLADLSSPLAYALAVLFSHLLYLVLLAPLVLHLCLSFPDTKGFVRRSPRLLALVYLLPWGVLALSSLLEPPLGRQLVYAFVGLYSLFGSAVFTHTLLTVYDPLRRAQVRWVALGFGVVSLNGLVWSLGTLGVLRGPLLDAALAVPTAFVLTLSLALAVLRYRLFEVDLIINRTLVYGALTAAVVGLYMAVVGAVGALLGAGGNLTLSLVGTGLVAVLFQPLRALLQRSVNRLMYGQRDEPYSLLARLGRQVGAAPPEALLPTLARTLGEALKLPYAGLFLDTEPDADAPEAAYEYGAPGAEPVVFALEHHGERFGELRLGPRRGGFSPKELELLGTVARQLGVAAYTVRQTRRLRRSHERLVAAREEERLRLRRDLHDGLGPTLAGLNLHLGALKRRADDPDAVRVGLGEVQGELRRAAGEVRRIVHDLRPPSLEQLGFRGALTALAESVYAGDGPTVTLALPPLPPLSPATETALYRVVQEALGNALKHARASCIGVCVQLGEELTLTVTDDGAGLPEGYRAGVGLTSMRERAGALGGRFSVASSPRGTTVRVEVPLGAGAKR